MDLELNFRRSVPPVPPLPERQGRATRRGPFYMPARCLGGVARRIPIIRYRAILKYGGLSPKTGQVFDQTSQSRPRLVCLWGTFSPSRRQIRSTGLSLTTQPACSSKLAILRLP